MQVALAGETTGNGTFVQQMLAKAHKSFVAGLAAGKGYVGRMARPRAFDPEEALDRAKHLFWRKGYEATSVDDLVRALGINRGSLYGTFQDKRSLFLAALDRYENEEVAAALRILRAPELSGRQRIELLFEQVIRAIEERGDRRGCLLCNTAVELATDDAEMKQRVNAGLDQLQRAFSAALAGDPARSAESNRGAAAFLTAALMGVHVMAKAGADAETLRGAVRTAMRALA
jgi:TetR/AcrR family transcriptional repressor of nem operon